MNFISFAFLHHAAARKRAKHRKDRTLWDKKKYKCTVAKHSPLPLFSLPLTFFFSPILASAYPYISSLYHINLTLTHSII